jgi:tetratricopeptide (TPR) repeat protein
MNRTGPPDPLDRALSDGRRAAALEAAEDLVRAGPFAATRDALERAAARFPDEPRLAALRIELHARFLDWDGLDAVLPSLHARFPDRGEVAFAAGRALEARGQACAAIRAYGRAARLDPDDVDAVARVAKVFRARGRPFLARRRLRRGLARHPDAAPLHAQMAYAYVEDGQTAKAVAAFQRAVALDPEESPWLDELGVALLLAERWKAAASAAVRSIRARPGREKPWTVYAVAHRRLGNDEQAEKGYRAAVRHAREPGRARGNLGLFLAAKSPPHPEAREHLTAAAEAHPDWEEVVAALERLGPP